MTSQTANMTTVMQWLSTAVPVGRRLPVNDKSFYGYLPLAGSGDHRAASILELTAIFEVVGHRLRAAPAGFVQIATITLVYVAQCREFSTPFVLAVGRTYQSCRSSAVGSMHLLISEIGNILSPISSGLEWGFTFGPFLLLTFLIIFLYKILIFPWLSPLRKVPTARQVPLYKRLLKEPSVWQLMEYMKTPNDGIVRYHGILNAERLLLASPSAVREVFSTHAWHYTKQASQKATMEHVLGRAYTSVSEPGRCWISARHRG